MGGGHILARIAPTVHLHVTEGAAAPLVATPGRLGGMPARQLLPQWIRWVQSLCLSGPAWARRVGGDPVGLGPEYMSHGGMAGHLVGW